MEIMLCQKEQQLIAECKRGKPKAQEEIYYKFAPIMLGVCVRYVNDLETARDILQEGFIRLFANIDKYSGAGSFKNWARRIFVTSALEHLRKNDVLKFAHNIDDHIEQLEDINTSIIDKISNEDLMICIAKLPEKYRTVFNLHAIEGYSHAEIANMLKITEGTSWSLYARARKMLQKNIQRFR